MSETLRANNYRASDAPCCVNCRHCVLSGGEWCCRLTDMWQWVREACICDRYEPLVAADESEVKH
jgi:hypothetical protein